VNSPANVGSIFRISEAFGVQEIIFGNTETNLNSSRLKRTAREAHKRVPHRFSEDILATIDSLASAGYRMIALEITTISSSVRDLTCTRDSKIGLVIGNEQHGISEALLTKIDLCAHIELYGVNSSINVAQALSIALYEITNKLL
jgi:tRNA G18 (ribose-2'-O)-methylase SpoU